MIPLSGRVPKRASRPSRSQVDDGSGLQYVSWKIVWALRVFTMKGIYRRKGDCCLMASPLGTPRGKYDEYGSKSFPLVKKPRYVDLGEERQTTEGDAD
jgi:hypothetical protein